MKCLISARNLCLGYKKDEAVIKNANFDIYDKDFMFISGASGSGKSTLVRSIYGNLEVQSGSLNVNGCEMGHISRRKLTSLRRNIGVVFQDYKLVREWNVEDNIALPMITCNRFQKDEVRMRVQYLLSHVNLMHKADKYPMELSGGEQQRVALARAISHSPKIVLCDEPTGNLDDYSSDIIWKLLKSSNEQLDITIVVVTHRLPRHINLKYRCIEIADGTVNECA